MSCLGVGRGAARPQKHLLLPLFGRPVESLEELREAVATHASRAGREAAAAGAGRVGGVRVPDDQPAPAADLPQYHPQAGRELIVPSSFTPELVGECLRVLHAIYRPGYRYVKAGVLCLELVPDDEKQASLFVPGGPGAGRKRAPADGGRRQAQPVLRPRHRADRHGGASRQAWQMRRERMSPCYTTRLEDVPRATL